jgi:hypothetical protein
LTVRVERNVSSSVNFRYVSCIATRIISNISFIALTCQSVMMLNTHERKRGEREREILVKCEIMCHPSREALMKYSWKLTLFILHTHNSS